MKTICCFGFVLFLINTLVFGEQIGSDSSNHDSMPTSVLRLTARLHNMGLFSYGGRLVSSHPVMDINMTYARKNWEIQVFKAQDMVESRNPINFTLAVINKDFQVGKRLTITPSVGILLEQFESIADHGSDAVIIVNTTYKLSRRMMLDHSTLFGNLILEPEMTDWVNRLRLTYSKDHFDISLMTWHNNSIFDSVNYATAGTSIFYSRMKLGKMSTLNAGVTGLLMTHTSNEMELPRWNGIFLTMSVNYTKQN